MNGQAIGQNRVLAVSDDTGERIIQVDDLYADHYIALSNQNQKHTYLIDNQERVSAKC